jgi:hypothetical protein
MGMMRADVVVHRTAEIYVRFERSLAFPLMPSHWTTVYEGSFGGRDCKVQSYSEGGFRVITTQLCDEPGIFEAHGSSTLIIPPTTAGSEIHIEGETIDDLESNLLQDGGFSDDEAKLIISQLNSPSA